MNNLDRVLTILTKHAGPPSAPPVTDPFEMILFENVAYLVDDQRRLKTWNALKRRIGVRPQDILNAEPAQLAEAIRDGGMQPDRRAEKLRKAAEIAVVQFDGDLNALLAGPPDKALRGLKKFPGIGEPGAEKILLFTRTKALPALESNGLRVLLRLGFGRETRNYTKTYRSVQATLSIDSRGGCDRLIAAHQLLRRHGQTLCKRNGPKCGECPLAKMCPSAKEFMAS